MQKKSIVSRLLQCQRSSQQILDLANFINRHTIYQHVPNIKAKESFRGPGPTWISLTNVNEFLPDQFIEYATSNLSELKDVMFLSYPDPNLARLFDQLNWKFCNLDEITGSESSVIIIFDHGYFFNYESLTRARHNRHNLILITTSWKRSVLQKRLEEI